MYTCVLNGSWNPSKSNARISAMICREKITLKMKFYMFLLEDFTKNHILFGKAKYLLALFC